MITKDDIVIEQEDYNNEDGILTLFVGFYDDDGEFNGCAWDSHEQCNEWIIMGRTLWNKCDGDEDTMRFHFKDNFGEDVIKLIDDKFNKKYYFRCKKIHDDLIKIKP